jgi:UDP-N-acetylmuramoylalanine--D-glutamate ligase
MNARKIEMTDTKTLKNKKVLVVGMAKTGFSVANFLIKEGAVVTATDIKDTALIDGLDALKDKGVCIEAGGHRLDSFLDSELIVISPGVPINTPEIRQAIDAGVEVVGDIELASLYMTEPIVAVVGTNGKSTVTELLGEVFKRAGKRVFVGGNIGIPVTDRLASNIDYEVSVLEVSSFHLEAVKGFSPHIAILLNVTEDHLDRYRDFAEYRDTKFRVFQNQGAEDIAIVNAADTVITEDLGELSGKLVPFSTEDELTNGLYLKDGEIVYNAAAEDKEERYSLREVRLKGVHNIENIMAVIAAARAMGVSQEVIKTVLKNYKGLLHRMELIKEVSGVLYINDSKATNTGAVKMALKGMKEPVILIIGGRDKQGNFQALKDVVREKVKLVIAIGEAGEMIAGIFKDDVECIYSKELKDAIHLARDRASRGDAVLLSPGCSSFDAFSSFEERGECFRKTVETL